MDTLALQAYRALDADTAGMFWLLCLGVAFVCAALPALAGPIERDRAVAAPVRVLGGIHGTLLVVAPAVLLLPVIVAWPRLSLVPSLVYVALLAVRFLSGGGIGATTGRALAVVAAPWGWAVIAALAGGGVGDVGPALVDAALDAGRIAFAAFWLGFPFFILGRRPGARVRGAGPAGAPALLALAVPWALGLWLALAAWSGGEAAGRVPVVTVLGVPVFRPDGGHGWLVLAGALAQAAQEARLATAVFRDVIEGDAPAAAPDDRASPRRPGAGGAGSSRRMGASPRDRSPGGV